MSSTTRRLLARCQRQDIEDRCLKTSRTVGERYRCGCGVSGLTAMTLRGCRKPGWSSPLSLSRSARLLRWPAATGCPVLGLYAAGPVPAEGEAAFEPRSRRPKSSPAAVSPATVELVVRLRTDLAGQGLDAGPQTIVWHLEHHHRTRVSPATISRYLARAGAGDPRAAQTAEVVLYPVPS
jgi:hypothetical protein